MNRKYHGSRVTKSNRPKYFVGLLALLLILVGTIGGTVAYLATHTGPVVNTFTPGKVSCEVVEEFNTDKTQKTSVKVQNTGNVPAFIRVAVVANTVDAQGNITGAADVSTALAASDWTESGGYYYYKGIVQPSEVTGGNLLKSGIDLTGIQVTILASAIQSTPADAVEDAWHMSYNDGNWMAANSGN